VPTPEQHFLRVAITRRGDAEPVTCDVSSVVLFNHPRCSSALTMLQGAKPVWMLMLEL